jgi:hypothetical protein
MGGGAVSNVPLTPIPANWQPGQLNTAALTKYPPSSQRLAQQLVNYDVPMPTGIASGREPWVSAIQAASELDPTWKASEYTSRLSARRSFTSGADAKNITGINTAIGHLQTLDKAGTALGNSRFSTANEVQNWWKSKTGNASVVRFDVAANAVVNELASVFKGTGATDQEINAWRKTISPDQSPAQIKQSIKQAVELLGSRMDALKNKWEQSQGKPMSMQILSPKSRSVLKALGEDANALEAPATAATPAAAPAGPAAPTGAQPGEQTTINPQTGQRHVLRGGQWVPLP